MIGVGEKDRSAELLERFLRQPFDRGRRAHRQERRCFDYAVQRRQFAPSRRRRIRFLYFKRKAHPASVAGRRFRSPPTLLLPAPKWPTVQIRSRNLRPARFSSGSRPQRRSPPAPETRSRTIL